MKYWVSLVIVLSTCVGCCTHIVKESKAVTNDKQEVACAKHALNELKISEKKAIQDIKEETKAEVVRLEGIIRHKPAPPNNTTGDNNTTDNNNTITATDGTVIPLPPATAPPLADNLTTNVDDEAILSQVNVDNGGDTKLALPNTANRAVCFGCNYPGTDAELHKCVSDARRNALNLIKRKGFKPSEVYLVLNAGYTNHNIEHYVDWAMDVNQIVPTDKRVVALSSHGGEDTEGDTVTDVVVTYNMVTEGRWDSTTEVPLSYWKAKCAAIPDGCNVTLIFDSCHSGGSIKPLISSTTRRIKSLDGTPEAQGRVLGASKATSMRGVIESYNVTFIPMCGAAQLSEEADFCGGAGSWGLWEADLQNPNGTAAQIVIKDRVILRQNKFSQTPECHGRGANKPFIK